MKKLTKIELIPVISFFPFYYGIEEQYPTKATNEQRNEHWIKMMKRINFDDLVPIEEGYEFVRTDQLSDASLFKLLNFQCPLSFCDPEPEEEEEEEEEELEEEEEEEEEEVYSNIEGGVIVKGDDQIIFIPQCCTGFYDYKEWLTVKKSKHFHRIWTGHPFTYSHSKGDDIFFSGLIEDTIGEGEWVYRSLEDFPRGWGWGGYLAELDKAEQKELMCQFVVKHGLFQEAQQLLQKEIDLFYDRVLETLQKMEVKNPVARADRYVKGIGGPVSYDSDKPIPLLPIEQF